MSPDTRSVTIFSGGCPLCEDVVARVRERACSACEIEVVDLSDPGVAERAGRLGVGAVPAVAIDGELAGCCEGGGPDLAALEEAGLGRPPA